MTIVAVSVASAGAGYWFAAPQSKPQAETTSDMPAERKVLYWYDPMMPGQHFDQPGKSPFMDMELVPMYADEAGGGADDKASIRIDPAIMQNLGMRTAAVTRGTLESMLDVAANVMLNERDIAVVQAKSAGFVERVHARAPGDVVKRGEALVDLRVPDWIGAQHELIAVKKSGDAELLAAVRERLRSLGMPDGLIEQVEKSGAPRAVVTITAPLGGVIQSMEARTGMAVAMGETLARINGLDTVWIEAEIPQAQAGMPGEGRDLPVEIAAYPGERFTAKVIAVLPEASLDSRTVRLRLALPNADGSIRPGMFARVRLGSSTPSTPSVLLVPSEAVIRGGKRDIVLLVLEGGRYRPVEVRLGRESDGKVVVLEGLEEGQQIVVSGQFLIDSEASLKGVMARALDDRDPARKHDHGDRDADTGTAAKHQHAPPPAADAAQDAHDHGALEH